MLKKIIVLFSLLLTPLLFASCPLEVKNICVIIRNPPPAKTFDTQKITSEMKTKAGGVFVEEDFDQDLKELSKQYDHVEPDLEISGSSISITLYVTLKYKISSIEVSGTNYVSKKKVLKEINLDTGDDFTREKWIEGLNKAKTLYLRKGFYLVNFDDRVCYDDCNSTVSLQLCIDEGHGGRIGEIRFVGVDEEDAKELTSAMLCARYHPCLAYLPGKVRCYQREVAERDEIVLTETLHNKGYADASVKVYTEPSCEGDRLNLVIVVEKGPLYTVGTISIRGNKAFSKADLLPCIKVYNKNPFSSACLAETTRALRDKYGACGFIDAVIAVEPKLRGASNHIYDIDINIDENDQYWVRMINVSGNKCTRTRVVLNETLLCPGELFSLKKMEWSEQRICNTGLFKSTNVYPTSTEDPNYKDLNIEVEEGDTGNVGLFLGLNSFKSIFGGVDITEQNFNACGILGLFATRNFSCLRGNGEYLHLKANIGDKSTTYLGQWTKPYFFDTPWIVGFDVQKDYNRYMSKGYTLKTADFDTHATYILNCYLKFRTHYRLKYSSASVKDDKNPLLKEEGHQNGLISMLGAALYYDSTDHPRRPTKGFRSRLSYDYAGLGGKFDYMKFSYLNTYYYPICRRGIFKLRGDLQFIKTYSHTDPTDLPLGERLYQGGETSVRGYRPYILGPKFGNNEPRGGMSSFLISEEYQHMLIPNPRIDAFVFCDAGYVSLSEFTLGRHAASVGFGVRLEVMKNVPMAFGMGYPIHPYEEQVTPDGQTFKLDLTQRFFFSMGTCF